MMIKITLYNPLTRRCQAILRSLNALNIPTSKSADLANDIEIQLTMYNKTDFPIALNETEVILYSHKALSTPEKLIS